MTDRSTDMEWKQHAARVPYVEWDHAGILPTQMMQFVGRAKTEGVTHVAESGRRNGYSTEFLGLAGFDLFSVDWDPNNEADDRLSATLPFAVLAKGDGRVQVPRWLDCMPRETWAVLLDGPKGDKAIALAKKLDRNERVRLMAIHDVQNGTDRLRKLEKAFPGRIVMSTPFDVSPSGILINEPAARKAGQPDPVAFAEFAPLCMIVREPQ